MDLKQIVIFALQLSVLCTVFGFGLQTTTHDLSYLIRRPGLLARSLLAMFVIMPVVAVLLALLFDFRPIVERALIILAISPAPPLLPRKGVEAGDQEHYALGLIAVLALTAIVVMPLEILAIQVVAGRPLEMAFGAVVRVLVISILLPLAAGMAVRAFLPRLIGRIEKPIALIAKILLPLGLLVLLVVVGPGMWEVIGDGTLIAIITFIIVGFAVGHLLGGPDPDHSVVLALSTACRHPAIALSIAAANFPEERFGAIILLCLIIGAIAGLPYMAWQRRRTALRPA
ncbi:MAG TPA: hypothetical protein VEX68_18285 [Bryobacteraceae bacterium]|nr:hypothetical protein [Bryobacteraceae bacterium]